MLGAFYALSEFVLAIARRSRSPDRSRDRNSLAILWIVICVAIICAIFAASLYPTATFPHRHRLYFVGVCLFVAGLLLRWYSIAHLGRFFTVDVAIARQHTVVDSGPYRLIRHPSYSGALLAFVGIGLCLGNWLSLLIIILPVLGAFLWRIHVEEAALCDALGEKYLAYTRRTKRLIPLVY
jgi:protein-S-isoprenylcysteine O-methyltransferase